MLNQLPTSNIAFSNQIHDRAQLNEIGSHWTHSATDNNAMVYDLHHFESDAKHLEFIDSCLADNT